MENCFSSSQRVPNSARRSKSKALSAALCLSAAACASTPDPYIANNPKAPPREALTSVSDALTCMDDLFVAYKISKLPLTIKGIPDHTGQLQAAHQDMLISAISRMSRRSNAFEYYDLQSLATPYAASDPFTGALANQKLPALMIRGAMSQLDEGTVATSKGGGIRAYGVDLGGNKGRTVSIVSMDMHVAETATGRVLHFANSRNSIAFSKSDKSMDGGAEIAKNGLFFQFSISQSEGMAQAVRTLIEFTAIETLGKLTGTPYWRCLGMSGKNPEIVRERREAFDRLSVSERIRHGKRTLGGMGRYTGAIDGAPSTEFSDALATFQSERGIQATGEMNEVTYLALEDTATSLAGSPPQRQTPPTPAFPGRLKLALLATSPAGPARVGDIARAVAKLDDDGYLYCYYRDGKGSVARVFPNRWQPDAFVKKNSDVEVPARSAGFDIKLEQANVEEMIVCFASRREFGTELPDGLKRDDMAAVDAGSFQAFAQTMNAAAGSTGAAAAVVFKVSP